MERSPFADRREVVTPGEGSPTIALVEGIEFCPLVSGELGAQGLCTGSVTCQPGAELPVHIHPVSEAIVPLAGEVHATVEDRRYRLGRYDALHIPAGVVHGVQNDLSGEESRLFVAFASPKPVREWAQKKDSLVNYTETDASHPEHITRFETAEVYELSHQANFCDLVAGRFGSKNICGGYGIFQPGASLPCHVHGYDESITIVKGTAVCQVVGKEYELSNLDTVCVPQGLPHRFINRSDFPMAMLWIYAGDEPDRTILEQDFCDGALSTNPKSCRGTLSE